MSSTLSDRAPVDEPSRQQVRDFADLLDTRFRVPGTTWRFGVDSLIGLIPGIGDAAGLVLSSSVVLNAVRLGARGATVVRMVGNVVIDAAVGAIPVLGSVFDFAFKANVRNVRLLERHVVDAEETRAQSAAAVRRTIVLAVLALVLVVAAVVGGTIWLLTVLL